METDESAGEAGSVSSFSDVRRRGRDDAVVLDRGASSEKRFLFHEVGTVAEETPLSV